MIDFALSHASISSANLSVLRCFRLLRVFKLARSWKELNRILTTVLNSMPSLSYLSLLLALFFFIMAVLAMQVFGYQEIFCDAYNLGPSVQPTCPVGLSTAAGTCPPKHYYDCYAPCDPSTVGQWLVGQGGSYQNPGLPVGYCKACLPPATSSSIINVTTLTYLSVPATCSLALPEILSGTPSTPCGYAWQAFGWYLPTTVTCNASAPGTSDTTTPCGLAYTAFTLNTTTTPVSGTLNAAATADGVNTVVLGGPNLPVTINSMSFSWVGTFGISYVDAVSRTTTQATCSTSGPAPSVYCRAGLAAFTAGGVLAAVLPAGATATASNGVAVTVTTPNMTTWNTYQVTYPAGLSPTANALALTTLSCTATAAAAQGVATPCGLGYSAYGSNGAVVTSGGNATLVAGQWVVLSPLNNIFVIVLNASLGAGGAFSVSYPPVLQTYVPYVNVSSPLLTDGLQTLLFPSTATGGTTVNVVVQPFINGSSGNSFYGTINGNDQFSITYQDGSASIATTPTVQYPRGSEFWMWVGPPYVPRMNSDDFFQAFMLVFEIISTENWNNVRALQPSYVVVGLFFLFF